MKDKKEKNDPINLGHIPQNAVESLKAYFEKSWQVLKVKNSEKKTDKSDIEGFTLVELAIVIVIIGLLVGGVMGGQSLIDASKVSRAVSDFNKYNAAIQTFKAKYNALPGDMRNAYTFFDGTGGSSICGSNNSTTNATGCNGNGDGLLGAAYYDYADVGRMWVHLTLSNIIPGLMTYKSASPYDGIVSSPKDQANAPASTVSENAVWDYYGSNYYTTIGTVYGQAGSWLTLTSPSSMTGFYQYTSWRFGNALSPSIAQAIDLKIDDGLPTMGSVLAVSGSYGAVTGGCGTSGIAVIQVINNSPGSKVNASSTIQYNNSDTRNTCNLLFRIGL